MPIVLLFVALTFVSWGLYGPVLHLGQDAMDHSLLRPFICVGLAYFLIAVLAPVLLLRRGREPGQWSIVGAVWSFLAGAAGAVGALGIIVAFRARGNPVYVMPLVFGCAPVVNTLVTMWMTKTVKQAGTFFYAGVLLVAIGAAGVLVFKPQASGASKTESASAAAAEGETESETRASEPPLLARELFTIIAAIAVTALCWGSYGPMLHKGQVRMAGSRLRPFLCVGLAYFALAVILPAGILLGWPEPGRWSPLGTVWSLGGGAFGALGALGIIMAFNFGGRPIYVMPLVFGGAPVVNTLTSVIRSLIQTGSPGQFRWLFYPSLLLVIVGAVMVLVFSPKARPEPEKKAPRPKPKKEKRPRTDADRPASPEPASVDSSSPRVPMSPPPAAQSSPPPAKPAPHSASGQESPGAKSPATSDRETGTAAQDDERGESPGLGGS
jgi:hypothetical protein